MDGRGLRLAVPVMIISVLELLCRNLGTVCTILSRLEAGKPQTHRTSIMQGNRRGEAAGSPRAPIVYLHQLGYTLFDLYRIRLLYSS